MILLWGVLKRWSWRFSTCCLFRCRTLLNTTNEYGDCNGAVAPRYMWTSFSTSPRKWCLESNERLSMAELSSKFIKGAQPGGGSFVVSKSIQHILLLLNTEATRAQCNQGAMWIAPVCHHLCLWQLRYGPGTRDAKRVAATIYQYSTNNIPNIYK